MLEKYFQKTQKKDPFCTFSQMGVVLIVNMNIGLVSSLKGLFLI